MWIIPVILLIIAILIWVTSLNSNSDPMSDYELYGDDENDNF